MRTQIVINPLDDLLSAACRPPTKQMHSANLRQAMDAAFSAAKAESGPRRTLTRSRSRAAGVVFGLGLLVAGIGAAPAFAEWVGLRTGTYETGPSSAFSAKAPERELWRMDSPELVPRLQAWTVDYPLAPGYTIAPLVRRYATAKNSQMAADSYRTDVFLYSECTWVDAWVNADDRDDAKGRKAAGAGLTSLLERGSQAPSVDLEDAHRDYLRRLASAAAPPGPAEADRTLLRHEREVGCGWNYR